MEESSWSVLIDQIEKVDKKRKAVYGDFVLVDADSTMTFYRKVLFLLDMVSPILFVLKRPVRVRIGDNRLLVPREVMAEYKKKINIFASNYVWLISFLEKTLKLLDEVERKHFNIPLKERMELEGRIFLIQLHLINKLLEIYKNILCREMPLPKPIKPSYNTYLTSLIAKKGLENVARDHPFVKMFTVWMSMQELESIVLRNRKYYAELYSNREKELLQEYKANLATIMKKVEQEPEKAFRHGVCMMLYSLLSHLMWITEWENYYTFNTREKALHQIKRLLEDEQNKNMEEVLNDVIKRVFETL